MTLPPLWGTLNEKLGCAMSDYPTAIVREVNGQLVLDSPMDEAVINAIDRHNRGINRLNCEAAFKAQADRVAHFKGRCTTLGHNPADYVIVLLSVDDLHGGCLADTLMPGFDWQVIRDRGEAPWARGLVVREGLKALVASISPEKAAEMDTPELVVVVMSHGCVEIFQA